MSSRRLLAVVVAAGRRRGSGVFAGLILAGRVAVDTAGRVDIACAVAAAALVMLIGYAVERSSEAHGDGLEFQQVVLAALIVLLVVGGTALLVDRRRRTRGVRG